MTRRFLNRDFIFKIIIPTLFVFSVFTILIFAVIIPSIKDYMLDGKREMIRELTNSAWSVLDKFEKEAADSLRTDESAQQEAIKSIENMRYGHEGKDYFWITDMHPFMIMHPYRTDLNRTDLSNYKDPTGKILFVESVRIVESSGEGYVDYMWQWKDDSTQIVPKLSFVKSFPKWGWIIGTGIYIEDINEEIASLTNNLFYFSLLILLILGFNLYFISRQSLLIETRRQAAEIQLIESESKYRSLVEASTDGLVMMLDGQFIYSNLALMNMLGFAEDEVSAIDLGKILCNSHERKLSGAVFFSDLSRTPAPPVQFAAQLQKKDGTILDAILYTSEITLGKKTGYTIIIKDISTHRQIEEERDMNRERYQTLADSIKIGVFRSVFGTKGKIVKSNTSAAAILGYDSPEELYAYNIPDLFVNREDRKIFEKKLRQHGSVKNLKIPVKTKDGGTSIVSVSAVLVNGTDGGTQYLDGTLDDITDKARMEERRENLIVELQTSLRFLNQPISHFLKHHITVNMNLPIYKVAKLMTREKFSAALVKKEPGEIVGIITDHDLRRRVVSENFDMERPIFEVMSSPLITISSTALVFEAFLIMNETATRHLAVRSQENEIIGIISSEELITVQKHSTSYLLREIENAETVEDIVAIREKVQILVKVFIDSGAKSQIITHIITSIFEAISEKLISFAIDELGQPPVAFAFLVLGSVGRKEQTLTSDQDNAILYADVPPDSEERVHSYFHQLGTKVCDWLNDCGYVYCQGEAMAKNPKWCQSISRWQDYFHSWITNSDQQDLIDLSIFFDFRCVYGDEELAGQLQKHVFKTADGQAGFFQHLTKNSVLRKPPVGLTGKIRVESKGEHQETFDIKSAIMPISDFARIYALKNQISPPNSLERLEGLLAKGVINRTTYEELKQAYTYLMQLRFKHQAEQITENSPIDNHINPDGLTQIEQKTLKNIFSQILSMQKKLNFEFTGDAL